MSIPKIWLKNGLDDLKAAAAYLILVAISFSNSKPVRLSAYNWGFIAKRLGIDADVKADNVDVVASKVAPILKAAGVQVVSKDQYPTESTEWKHHFKVWDDGSCSVTATSPSYPGGFFNWSLYHCFVQVGDLWYKLAHVVVSEGAFKVKDGVDKKEAKKACPKKNTKEGKFDSGLSCFIDPNWAVGKVFFKREEMNALGFKAEGELQGSENPDTADFT